MNLPNQDEEAPWTLRLNTIRVKGMKSGGATVRYNSASRDDSI